MKFSPPILSCSNENICFHVGDYSFGFNGKDKESEFNSGAYDFGARIHDARLGRWMSVDPDYHLSHYSSPYVSFANNPIIFVDPGGNHNIIYLIILPGAKKGVLSMVFWRKVALMATSNFKTLGLKTEVKVYEGKPEDFVINNMDATDAVYVIGGSAKEIETYASKELDPVGTARIMQKGTEDEWKGGAQNPERTENWEKLGKNGEPIYGGDLAFIDVSQILETAKILGLINTNDFKPIANHIKEVQEALGVIILHAAGHSSGLGHKGENNSSWIMSEYEGLSNLIKSYKVIGMLTGKMKVKDLKTREYSEISQNADYIKALITRFKADEPAVDNYKDKK